jgi:hypothetical protein
MTTYERSKGVPVCDVPIVCAKLDIGAALERAFGNPEFPIGPPPKAHVAPLLTTQVRLVLEVLRQYPHHCGSLHTHFAIR